MHYRRALVPGGTYFFTVNLADRRADLLVRHIEEFRQVLGKVKRLHPLYLVAMAVMPDHLHTIWRLPEGDADYPMRWALIKAGFSRRLAAVERVRQSRKAKRERGIWQRRYWEHQIRDEADLARHVDYIHYNAVKHGLVARPADWPHSTLHAYIERGLVAPDWGASASDIGSGYGERLDVGLPSSAQPT
ncbi:MAG TPA: transposase [Gammaproteobacteria bacterium]|nr:transposase [Gammaproteobacteria bacterium]